MRILLAIVCLVGTVTARDPGETPQIQYDETSPMGSVTPAIQSNILHVIFQELAKIPFFSVKFWLYTRQHPQGNELEPEDPQNVSSSVIDPRLPIKIVVHGFLSNHQSAYMQNMKDVLLEQEDVNVILINWESGAALPFYIPGVVVFIRRVGLETVALLHTLQSHFGFSMKDVHVVGHSLGAHIAGFIGQNVMIHLNQSVARITGLDPAGVLFELSGLACRLDPQDADFVDVIHTNAGYLFTLAAGLGKLMGDVDFYPNGGKLQPGCGGIISDIVVNQACSHSRVWELFTESIRYHSNHGFKAYKCGSYAQFKRGECFTCEDNNCGRMGYHVHGRGAYYLDTRNSTPYQGQHLLMNARMSGNNKKFCGSLRAKMLSGGNGPVWKQEISLSDAKPGGDVNVVVVPPHNASFSDVFMKYKVNKLAFWCPSNVELEWFIVRHDTGIYDYMYTACGPQWLKKEEEAILIPTDC